MKSSHYERKTAGQGLFGWPRVSPLLLNPLACAIKIMKGPGDGE